MEREMRRKDRQMTDEAAMALLETGKYGVLCVVDEDGAPYGVPLSYAWVDGRVCFHCAKGVGHKYDAIMKNRRVCFTVVGATEILPSKFSTNYESVMVFGVASQLAEGEEKQRALEGIIQKYSSEFYDQGLDYIARGGQAADVFAIKLLKISGKARK